MQQIQKKPKVDITSARIWAISIIMLMGLNCPTWAKQCTVTAEWMDGSKQIAGSSIVPVCFPWLFDISSLIHQCDKHQGIKQITATPDGGSLVYIPSKPANKEAFACEQCPQIMSIPDLRMILANPVNSNVEWKKIQWKIDSKNGTFPPIDWQDSILIRLEHPTNENGRVICDYRVTSKYTGHTDMVGILRISAACYE